MAFDSSSIDFDFFPDACRAADMDTRMLQELGASLAYLADSCQGAFRMDEGRIAHLTDHLANGRPVAPTVFADYFDAAYATMEQNFAKAEAAFARLEAHPMPNTWPDMDIVRLGDPALGEDTDRFICMMNSDPSIDLSFEPASEDLALDFRKRLDEGFALLDQTLPELAAEIRNIIRLLVICASDPDKYYQFDGGSHYQLWGALFLNARFHQDRIAVAEVLAHEAAHSLLFGFCTDEPLVTNPDDEVYASPLRVDERPMDGIYHATYVSARMHWAMTQIAGSGVITEDERTHALSCASRDMKSFYDGLAVVEAHGETTALGKALMANAKAYMDAA